MSRQRPFTSNTEYGNGNRNRMSSSILLIFSAFGRETITGMDSVLSPRVVGRDRESQVLLEFILSVHTGKYHCKRNTIPCEIRLNVYNLNWRIVLIRNCTKLITIAAIVVFFFLINFTRKFELETMLHPFRCNLKKKIFSKYFQKIDSSIRRRPLQVFPIMFNRIITTKIIIIKKKIPPKITDIVS